jgi:methionyl-tRNA formyltransferase
MRVVFMGNHTVGVRTLATLCRSCEVTGVVAHPPDVEDAVRYESVYDFATRQGLSVKRLRPTDDHFQSFVRAARPDLIWLTDYRYIVPRDILVMARLGAINLHPGLLPKYRGRAPLNWAIINGETRLGLTAHFVSEDVDAGDIVAQESFDLAPSEDVGDALEKLYPMYENITAQVLGAFEGGTIQRTPQANGVRKVHPPRRPEDGWIDWRRRASDIGNLVRGVTRPYPGAFGFVGERRVTFWKCAVEQRPVDAAPGTILEIAGDGSFRIACGSDVLIALDYSVESAGSVENAGPVEHAGDACKLRESERFELEHTRAAHAG